MLAPEVKLRTSVNGTTFNEEISSAIFSMQRCAKECHFFLVI